MHVSTAAEETKNPQRNMPIGLIGSLLVCTIFYMLVGGRRDRHVGAQPVFGPNHEILSPGTPALSQACLAIQGRCGRLLEGGARLDAEAGRLSVHRLARRRRRDHRAAVGHPDDECYGQTRIFFVMSRDGLLPEFLSKVHPPLPHAARHHAADGRVRHLVRGLLPRRLLRTCQTPARSSPSPPSRSRCVLRRTDPNRARPFRTPLIMIVRAAVDHRLRLSVLTASRP